MFDAFEDESLNRLKHLILQFEEPGFDCVVELDRNHRVENRNFFTFRTYQACDGG
jgi:hypothetical protein